MIFGLLALAVLIGVGLVGMIRGLRSSNPIPKRSVRLGGVLGGLLGGVVLVAAVFGGGTAVTPLAISPLILLPVVGLILLRQRSARGVADGGWQGAVVADAPTRVARPAPASDVALARALGRAEAREMATSAWFGVGIGFCVLIVILFGWVWADDDSRSWTEYFQLAPWFAHPMVGLAVVAAHRAVTRAHRDGTAELFDTCPASSTARTAGFLGASVAPVAAVVTMFGALVAVNAVRSPYLHGPVGGDAVLDLAAAVLLAIGGVALGVALGRWVRFGLVPMAAVVAVAIASLSLNAAGGDGWHGLTQLATAPAILGPSPVFQDRAAGWHLLWIVGLTALTSVIAVARHARGHRVLVAGLVSVALVVAAGVGATRPMPPAAAAEIADRVAHPERHQVCRSSGGVRVCVYLHHEELLDRALDRMAPIASVLPGDLPPITFRQIYDDRVEALPPAVRRLLGPGVLVRPRGEWSLGYGESIGDVGYGDVGYGDVGFDLAFAALGLPLETGHDLLPEVLAGQARGVVTIWLATRGMAEPDAARASRAAQPGSPDPTARGSIEPLDDPCVAPSVVWSAQDLQAARAVMSLPQDRVASVVQSGWGRWADPTTTTDELLSALGLPSVGSIDAVVARPGNSC